MSNTEYIIMGMVIPALVLIAACGLAALLLNRRDRKRRRDAQYTAQLIQSGLTRGDPVGRFSGKPLTPEDIVRRHG